MKKIVSTSDGAFAVAQVWGDIERDIPIVLIHGLSQQRFFWLPTISRLRHRPVIAVDLRGHGEADVPDTADFSVPRCAMDVIEILDAFNVSQAVIVGHSWGASVALNTAASAPDRCTAAVLLDGGIFGPWDQGPGVRERLTPPALGIPAQQLWAMMQMGPLGQTWTPEIQAALQQTFIEEDGLVRTRLGMPRHMAVLDGLLAYQPAADIASLSVPTWVVICEHTTPEWVESQNRGISSIPADVPVHVQHWGGATHDVPLQWPWMTAGLLDTVVAEPGPKEPLRD